MRQLGRSDALFGQRVSHDRWDTVALPKKAAPPPPPKPQGTGGKKCTPTGTFDPAAGKDVYEPEKIVGQRLMHGDLQKSAKDSTLEHSLFAAFNTE